MVSACYWTKALASGCYHGSPGRLPQPDMARINWRRSVAHPVELGTAPPRSFARILSDSARSNRAARAGSRRSLGRGSSTPVRQSEPDHGQPDGHHPAASGSAATYALRGPPTPRPPLAACDFASAPLAPRRSIRLAGHQFASQLVSRRHVGRPGRYGQGSKEEPRDDLTQMAADDSPSECRRGGAQRHLRTRLSRRPGGRRRSISREYDRYGPAPVGAVTGPDVLETTLRVRPR
jgi:hypothetical protein